MADFADAQRVTELAVIARLTAPSARRMPDEDADGRYCLSCGDLIPLERVAAVDAVRCIYLQQRIESAMRLKKGAMDIAQFKYLSVLNTVGTVAIGAAVWLSGKDKATNSRISAFERDVDDRMESHGERLTRLETKVQSMPTHEDIRQLREEVKRQTEAGSASR